jgi:hypothetical protein
VPAGLHIPGAELPARLVAGRSAGPGCPGALGSSFSRMSAPRREIVVPEVGQVLISVTRSPASSTRMKLNEGSDPECIDSIGWRAGKSAKPRCASRSRGTCTVVDTSGWETSGLKVNPSATFESKGEVS